METGNINTWPEYRKIPDNLNITREVLDNNIERGFGEKIAFKYADKSISYKNLYGKVNSFSQGLKSIGIRHSDHVLVRLPNSLEFIITFLALVRIGAVPVLQNSLLEADEVSFVRKHSDAIAAITFENISAPIRALRNEFRSGIIVARGMAENDHSFEDLLKAGDDVTNLTANTKSDEKAFMVYTSGTTGNPKGIIHAHRWIAAQGDTNKLRVPPLQNDVVMATGEWSFISALGHNVLYPLRNGVTGAILEGRMRPERILKTIEDLGVSVLYSVATVYRRILAIPEIEKNYNLASLRGCNATGEALEEATYTEWVERFGCPIWEHYGISEMQLVFGQSPHWPIKPGSVGKPLPGTIVKVMDDDYQELAPEKIGHLLIASDNPGFFLGYHKDKKKTKEVVHDGWYHTGDLAYKDDDGFIWIAGRSDDCFKSRGIFISPIEIENVIRQMHDVNEACILPFPDKEIGNEIRAVIVLKNSSNANPEYAEALKRKLEDKIAPYKIPQIIEFIDELPKSPVGKVLRRSLNSL